MLNPFSNRPKITSDDLRRGFVNRYFVKNVSDRRIVEVDAVQYKKFVGNPYFESIIVPWVITGNEADTIDPTTGQLVLGVPKRNLQIIDYYDSVMKGLRRNLRNPMEYFNGTPAPQKFPIPPVSEQPPFVPLVSTREYQSQFQVSTFLENASTDLRPDAISFDYKTAFTLGPVAVGDVDAGLFQRVWKVWVTQSVDNNTQSVWYAGSSGGGWSPSQSIFSFTSSRKPVIELDAAFEQLGRFNVVTQRNTNANGGPEVWLYWFDPLDNRFLFQNLGTGRTPRIALDNWTDTTQSDILVFYIDDGEGRIKYRAQKDRFQVVYNTPIVTSENTYLEKAAFASDYRFRVTYSERNPYTGKYELKQLASDRYPVRFNESYFTTGSFVSAGILELVKTSSLYDAESYYTTGSFVTANIQDIIVTRSLYDAESYFTTGSFVTAGILEIIKTSSLYDAESYFTTGSFVTAGTLDILITSSLYDAESYFTTGSFVSAEIVIP